MIESDTRLAELPIGWIWTSLGEICDVCDRDHTAPKYSEKGVPLISPGDFTDNGIDMNSVKYVGSDELENFRRKCKPKFEDILFSRIGTIGEARSIDFKQDFVALHSIAIIKPNRQIVTPKYILYLLQTYYIKNLAIKNVKSVGTPDLGLQRIKNFKIPLSPLPEQYRIVAKIEELFSRLDAGVEALKKAQVQLECYEM